jgi:urea transport system permease protein
MTALRRFGPAALFVLIGLFVLSGAFGLQEYYIGIFPKYFCYAIVGIGIALAWGRGGMLVLGQGVFFGIGGYVMGIYLTVADLDGDKIPEFMSTNGRSTLPLLWKPFAYGWFAIPAIVILPMLVAGIIGALVFRQRIRGPYFAIISQALAAAFAIVLTAQPALTGGSSGLSNFSAFPVVELGQLRLMYVAVAGVLLLSFLLARQLVRSRFGRLLVAIRDAEPRVRFLGYDPALFKTLTFMAAAGLAGIGGALYVLVVGSVTPSLVGVVPSIALLIGVAVGGRASLIGAAVGSVAVAYANSTLSENWPSGWVYLQGALFVVVMMFAPKGLAGLARSGQEALAARRSRPAGTPPPEPPAAQDPASDTLADAEVPA